MDSHFSTMDVGLTAPERPPANPLKSSSRPRVAIVHDWLTLYGGAERVLEQIIHLFPDADLFSMVDLVPAHRRGFLADKKVQTSFIQKLPLFARQRFRGFLPLMPCVIEQFDLSAYDLILSSSYSVAKGVITGPNQLHVSYCHSPMRFAWEDQSVYLRKAQLMTSLRGLFTKVFLHYFRMWDAQSQQRVDHFVTSCQFVRRRIEKFYHRDADIVHPPVDVRRFTCQPVKEDHYLVAGHMEGYKKIGLVVDAFAKMPNRRLRVLGHGPEFAAIARCATPNVRLLGYQPNAIMREEMQRAKALIFAGEEDFGILPVEAQACGTPVIAYDRGGLRETIEPGATGLFFHEQTPEAICEAVDRFEQTAATFNPWAIRRHAERFSTENFREKFWSLVAGYWREFTNGDELPPATAKTTPVVLLDRLLPTGENAVVEALR